MSPHRCRRLKSQYIMFTKRKAYQWTARIEKKSEAKVTAKNGKTYNVAMYIYIHRVRENFIVIATSEGDKNQKEKKMYSMWKRTTATRSEQGSFRISGRRGLLAANLETKGDKKSWRFGDLKVITRDSCFVCFLQVTYREKNLFLDVDSFYQGLFEGRGDIRWIFLNCFTFFGKFTNQNFQTW